MKSNRLRGKLELQSLWVLGATLRFKVRFVLMRN